MPQNPTPPNPVASNCILFGDNKAIAAITFESDTMQLGAVFHIPTRIEDGKTFYRSLACKITITRPQQVELVRLLGGECSIIVEKEGNA